MAQGFSDDTYIASARAETDERERAWILRHAADRAEQAIERLVEQVSSPRLSPETFAAFAGRHGGARRANRLFVDAMAYRQAVTATCKEFGVEYPPLSILGKSGESWAAWVARYNEIATAAIKAEGR